MWVYLLVLAVSVTAGRLHPRRRFGADYQSESVEDKEDDFYLRFREGRVDEIPEMMSVRVETNIVNRFAVTQVDQVIFNPKKGKQIGAFVVAMSPQALVSKLSLRGEEFLMEKASEGGGVIDDGVMDSQVDDGSAMVSQEDDDAVKRRSKRSDVNGFVNISASLQNVFSSSLGIEFQELILPVLMGPEENVSLSIVYEELLAMKSGKYQYALHLNIGEVIPDLAVKIEISDQADITGVVVTAPVIGDTTKEALKQNGDEKQKLIEFDMTVQEQGYYFGSDGFSGNLLTEYEVRPAQSGADISMEDGYFVHFYKGPTNFPHIPKHVMLVVDNAVAINEAVIKSSEIARKVIENLYPEDYLNIISFNGTVLEWDPTIKVGNAPIEEAFKCQSQVMESGIQFVLGLQKGGFSDIVALVQSSVFIGQRIKMSNNIPDNVLSIMLIIIDSHTEIPEINPETLTIVKSEDIEFPIYSLRISNNTQTNALQKLSRMTDGTFHNIDPAENIDGQLELFLRQFDDVLLKNVKITFKDDLVQKDSLTTTNFDYFKKGTNLVVAGKYDTNMNGTLEAIVDGESFDKTYTHQESPMSNLITAGFDGFNNTGKEPSINFVEKIWTYMQMKENMSCSFSDTHTNDSVICKFFTPFAQLLLKNNSSKTVVSHNNTEINLDDYHHAWNNEFLSSKEFHKARSLNLKLQHNLQKLDYSQLLNITSLLMDKWQKDTNLTQDQKQMWRNVSSEARNILNNNINATTEETEHAKQDGSLSKEKEKEILRKMLQKILMDAGLNELDLNTRAALVDQIHSINTPIIESPPPAMSTCSSSLTVTSFTGHHLRVASSHPRVHLVGVTYVRKDPEEALCCWGLYSQPGFMGRMHKFCGRFGPLHIRLVKSIKQL